jgi:hypothetical protein
MSQELYKIGSHIFRVEDLDAWVRANDWLLEWNHDYADFTYSLTKDSYSATLHIFLTPYAENCGSCEDEGITEGECAHEWYRYHELRLEELWSPNN